MRSGLLGLLSMSVLVVGGGTQQVVAGSGSDVQAAQPSAPMVTCTVRMNHWCIVQADARLNMTDFGDYRIWKMIAPESKREVVVIRESKSCDTPADLRPRRKSEREEQFGSDERHHTVEFFISSDGACTLKVQYLAGDTEWAREAMQLATNRIYLCSNGSCSQPLLNIR